MSENIVRSIGSHRFPGFYESIFCNSDEFIDFEQEDKCEIAYDFGIPENDLEVVYEYDDFNEYKKDVCKEYNATFVEKIKDVLPYDIVDHEDFKFEIIDEDDIEIFSPQYYNYSTDSCYSSIVTNRKTLKLIKEYTLRLDGVNDYIINHFTSCDGFISFISNDFQYWKELDIEDYEERHLIALLDMLIALSEEEGHFNIAVHVACEISNICYASPIIYYKGKKVTKEELKNKIRGEKMINKRLNRIEKYLKFLIQAAEIDAIEHNDDEWDYRIEFWGNQISTVYDVLITIAENHGLNKEIDDIYSNNYYLDIGTSLIKAIKNKRGE